MGVVKTGKTDNDLVRRGLKLGRLGASLTGSYLAYQVQNLMYGSGTAGERRTAFQQRASRRVRSELGDLKGPVMKIGQVLSMMGHVLPAESLEELALLQGQAPGMHPTLARAQFKAALGATPEALFAEFDAKPFAAASLGQVHRARSKKGEALAVKIQYPGIRTAIENDFKLLRSAALPGRVSGHVSMELLSEVEAGFLQETDYENEARNLIRFREAFEPITYLQVPRVYPEFSTGRVLTMSFVSGDSFGDFLARKPKRSLCDLIGRRLMEVYHYELRSIRGFHADPHPGNYLFREDGQIGLVDFGCVKWGSPDLSELVDTLVSGEWREQRGGEQRIARLICGNEQQAKTREGKRLAKTGIALYDKLFPESEPGKRTLDFGNDAFLKALTETWEVALRAKITNPEYAFASRAELGLVNLLHRFRSRIDTAEVCSRITDLISGKRRHLE